MKKIMFDKNFLISDLKKQIDYLEKTNDDEIDINEVCKNLVFTSISPLYDFRDMILLETIKKMDEKISKMDNEEKINIKDLTQSFLPTNIDEPYFNEIEDSLTLYDDISSLTTRNLEDLAIKSDLLKSIELSYNTSDENIKLIVTDKDNKQNEIELEKNDKANIIIANIIGREKFADLYFQIKKDSFEKDIDKVKTKEKDIEL